MGQRKNLRQHLPISKEVAVVIDPATGAIESVIDFSGLKEKVDQIPSLNVLNGIAYHPQRKTFL